MGEVYPGQTFRVVGCGGCSVRHQPFVGVGLSRGNLFVQLVRAARAVNVQRSCTETITLRYSARSCTKTTLRYSAPAPRQRYGTALLHRDNFRVQRSCTETTLRYSARSYTKTTLRYSAPTPRQRYGTALLHRDNVTVQRSWSKTTLRYSAPGPRQRYGTALLDQDNVTVQHSCTEITLQHSALAPSLR